MKQEHINYFAVGSFVLITLLVLMYAVYRVTGQASDTDKYYVELHNVSGIRTGSPVTYTGFQIGQLADITPVRSKNGTVYSLELQVKSGWSIPEDSTATIVTPGLLAEKTIDISDGKSKTILKPGAKITGIESADVFKIVRDMSNQFQELSDHGLKPLLDTVNREITGNIPKFTKQTSKLLGKLNDSADRLSKLMDNLDTRRINKIISNSETLTGNLLKMSDELSQASQEVNKLLQSTSSMVNDNNKDLRQAVIDLRTSMDVVANNINSVVDHIDTTARNMSEFSRQLRNNPGVLLNSKPPQDVGSQ